MIEKKILALFGGKHKYLVLAGVSLVILTLVIRFISVSYWHSIEWDMRSYHPLLPHFGFLWATLYMSVLYVKRVWVPVLWFIGIGGLAYSCIMYWAMYLVGP